MEKQVEADIDPQETREWLEALASVAEADGEDRARFLLRRLEEAARGAGVSALAQPFSAFATPSPPAPRDPIRAISRSRSA